jgi:hypothetical protein
MYSEAIMRARGPLLALLGVALLAWAAIATPPARPPVVAPPARTAATAPVVRAIGDLDRASARLGDGRRPDPAALSDPSRNPFEFVVARPRPLPPPKPAQAAAALAALAPLVLPPAPVSLVGLVDREVDGRIVRIAVLSFGGQLHYVEAGSRLGAAYEVVAVGSNAVDLLALDTNTPRRLVQR